MAAAAGRKVLIVGGGVGGLTAAIALRQAGVDATVFERASDLRKIQIGGGFVLWNNALRALQRLDLVDAVEAVSSPPLRRLELRSWKGRMLIDWPVGEVSRLVGVPVVGVRRREIHRVLANALGPETVRTGMECVGYEQDETAVRVRFSNGVEEQGDALIGADGARSTIRQQMLGGNDLEYAGYTLWNSIVRFDDEVSSKGIFREVWGRGSRFVIYPVGHGEMYWSCIINAAEGGKDEDSPKPQLAQRFSGWMKPAEAIIQATGDDTINRMDIYGRQPLERWGTDRVTLLGDAAHPMTPNQGQGAGLAIEDGLVIGMCLAGNPEVATALRAYEGRRMERTASIMKRSWRVGASSRLENPLLIMIRETGMRVRGRPLFEGHKRTMAFEF